jgi:hypothetical protein
MRIRLCPPEEFSTQGLSAQGAPATRVKQTLSTQLYSVRLTRLGNIFPDSEGS